MTASEDVAELRAELERVKDERDALRLAANDVVSWIRSAIIADQNESYVLREAAQHIVDHMIEAISEERS